MLREFWFQIFLALAGVAMGIVAGLSMAHKEKGGQQLLGAAILSYIWGDPVRGPFYGLRHLQASDKFYFHAGGKIEFPLSELSSGIDFSRIIHIGNNMPINLKVRRTCGGVAGIMMGP